MARPRDVPSLIYRSPGLANFSIAARTNIVQYQINGASNVNDAYGARHGVSVNNPLNLFTVPAGTGFISASLRANQRAYVDESNRNLTRIVFNPDDYATTPPSLPLIPPIAAYFPGDNYISFLRIDSYNSSLAAWQLGGLNILIPSDFNTSKAPTITFTGKAPNLAYGIYPVIPDTLDPYLDGVSMDIVFPGYAQSIYIRNLDTTYALYVTFGPGLPIHLIPPTKDLPLTGGGAPEMLVAADGGNPTFSVAFALANS